MPFKCKKLVVPSLKIIVAFVANYCLRHVRPKGDSSDVLYMKIFERLYMAEMCKSILETSLSKDVVLLAITDLPDGLFPVDFGKLWADGELVFETGAGVELDDEVEDENEDSPATTTTRTKTPFKKSFTSETARNNLKENKVDPIDLNKGDPEEILSYEVTVRRIVLTKRSEVEDKV